MFILRKHNQLINSVLNGTQTYWISTFILPKGVLKEIEQIMSRFLSNGDITRTHGIKISRDNVYKPKKERGLGFQRLPLLNSVLNLKHIWNLLSSDSQSLWVKWTTHI